MVIHADSVFYAFDSRLAPVATVGSGTTLTIETKDCFTDQIVCAGDFRSIDWDRVNPVTGPIAVHEARVGDILKVQIHDITIGDTGVMCVVPGAGVLGDQITAHQAVVMPIADGRVRFNDRLQIAIRPMIGVIGVAPAGAPVSTGTPGAHGGNMDNRVITAGSTLYLPVFHDGALFGLGDLHGAMGDGEVCVSGLEVSGRVTVTLSVVTLPRDAALNHPFVETAEDFFAVVSAATLEEATRTAVAGMARLLVERTRLPLPEVTMLMSLVGHTEIAQVVDPLVTARFRLPKTAVAPYFTRLWD